jgi:sarcosine oxidase subunit delta
MAFLLMCPNCGERGVHEFRFGGEVTVRPPPDASNEEHTRYFFFRRNVAGHQSEWWYHTFGCRKWFVAVRDTVTNEVDRTSWPEEAHS